ncbi:MAG: RHS repeat-associated core domain-containing protein [Cytophagales bacterium]|nr:MAG: RHS repeat-associated core domain-containing protein [Cytophagales bacterium]
MSIHKNSNQAIGNFVIYEIVVYGKTYKIGKADLDRITESSGNPTRLHQQLRKLAEEFGIENIDKNILDELFQVTTELAKEIEKTYLESFYETTGEVPEGNQKSFKPKNKWL